MKLPGLSTVSANRCNPPRSLFHSCISGSGSLSHLNTFALQLSPISCNDPGCRLIPWADTIDHWECDHLPLSSSPTFTIFQCYFPACCWWTFLASRPHIQTIDNRPHFDFNVFSSSISHTTSHILRLNDVWKAHLSTPSACYAFYIFVRTTCLDGHLVH